MTDFSVALAKKNVYHPSWDQNSKRDPRAHGGHAVGLDPSKKGMRAHGLCLISDIGTAGRRLF